MLACKSLSASTRRSGDARCALRSRRIASRSRAMGRNVRCAETSAEWCWRINRRDEAEGRTPRPLCWVQLLHAAAGTGPAAISWRRATSTRRLRPSSPCAPSNIRSSGPPNTTAAAAAGAPPAGIGAAGGAPGLNAVIEGALPGGYDVVVMANMDPPTAEKVARMIRGWLGAQD